MVNNYIRKTSRASWSEETMKTAIVEAKKSSIKSASQKYGIPYTTLQRHVKSNSSIKSLGSFKPVFNEEQEKILEKHLRDLDALFYGLSRNEFKELAGEYAKRQNIQTPFKNNIAGKQWFKNFLKRHLDIVLRSPEPTSVARLSAFNKPAVTRFYDLLETIVQEYHITPNMIYNMDETCVRTSSTKPPKVLSVLGKKQVGMVSSLERGTLTTVICCCGATGCYAPPPFFIFKRKRFQPRLLDGACPGSEGTISDSGWVSGAIFLEWLIAFVSYVRPTSECKALLILDNHESHKFYPALEYARDHNVIFLSIPPHTSHKLQPLDVAIYAPFKVAFEIEINKFQKQYPGRVISQYEIVRLVTPAYLKVATPKNAMSGFRAAGIYPYDRNVIDEALFAPSTVYEASISHSAGEDHRTPTPSQLETTVSHMTTDTIAIPHASKTPHILFTVPPDEITSPVLTTPPILAHVHTHEIIPPEQTTPVLKTPEKTQSTLTAPHIPTVPKTIDYFTSSSAEILKEIHPLPQQQFKKQSRDRKLQKSEIFTSTPVKTIQEDKFKKTSFKINLGASVSGLKKSTTGKKKDFSKLKTKSAEKTRRGKENEEKKYYCTVCKDLYTSPPIEDWIECSQCHEWTHESCSSYSGHGSYFCDFCSD
ncbi:unnamed protein product [Parnassius mnemosyne]|uniref:Zinc finger PHD-type domain-containing protein n=1 Tax=Parnassius mnemosyne TaxID=213953 RepID=A0AAV1M4D9_9NEOP